MYRTLTTLVLASLTFLSSTLADDPPPQVVSYTLVCYCRDMPWSYPADGSLRGMFWARVPTDDPDFPTGFRWAGFECYVRDNTIYFRDNLGFDGYLVQSNQDGALFLWRRVYDPATNTMSWITHYHPGFMYDPVAGGPIEEEGIVGPAVPQSFLFDANKVKTLTGKVEGPEVPE
jgi:hypothetical protein